MWDSDSEIDSYVAATGEYGRLHNAYACYMVTGWHEMECMCFVENI